ncbi:MAG: hypothetical protein JO250_16815 [Armatimonadetes bacterium]|nr:hypothetical protein [Armatimonadota bacterium]
MQVAQAQIIEGTSEEITALLQEGAFAGQRLRVIVEPETEEEDFTADLPAPPNTIRDAAHLEQLLLEGIRSGPATPMTAQDWQDIRQEVRDRAARRKGIPASDA